MAVVALLAVLTSLRIGIVRNEFSSERSDQFNAARES
jgi:hypothetical protein